MPEFLHTMLGPDFLVLYVIWLVLLFCVVLVLRKFGWDTPWVDLIGAILFLGLGIARLVVGSAHGMRKWSFLIILMFAGTILFFVRLERTSGGGSGSSCSSGGGCGGGGCGGGGCGGGGCGGCGGG